MSRASSVSRSSSSLAPSPSRCRRGATKAAPPRDTATAPRAGGRIDYALAQSALRGLATWAFDLVERDVAGDVVGLRRVRNARQFLLAQLGGKPAPRGASMADVQFTALRAARLLDRDLELGIGEHLDLIEALDHHASCLLAETLSPRRRPKGRRESTDLRGVTITRLPPGPIPDLGPTVGFAPPRLRFCEHCGLVHEESDHVPHRTYP